MPNDFYTPTGNPTDNSDIVSPDVRSEFTAINAGFDKLPSLSANAYKVVYINAAGSAMDVVGGNGLLKMSTTGVPTVAVAGVDYQAWSANLDEYAAVNPTAAGLALLDDADAAAQRTTLGLGTAAVAASGDFATAGHNHAGVYQPASANLDEYAAVNPTAAGLALLDDADAAAQRTTLGLVIGTNVQAYDADTAKTDVAQTFTASQRGTITTDNDGSFDLNATNNFKCTTAGALALTFTNIVSAAGQSGNIVFINSSNHAITAAANTKVASGTLAAISVTGTYLLGYFCDGTNVYVAATGAMT